MGNKIKDGMNGGGSGHGNVPDHIYKQVTNNVVGGGYGNKSGGPNSWGSPGGPGQPAYGSAEYCNSTSNISSSTDSGSGSSSSGINIISSSLPQMQLLSSRISSRAPGTSLP